MEGVSRWDYPDDIAICVALEAQRGWFSLDELSLFIFPEIKKPTDLLKAVEGLIARGWIVQDARQGVGYYRFTEDINEFAKSTEIDTPLHRRMAQYFEDRDEYAHKAAYHWEAAGETMLAFRCWTRAIDVCFDTGRDAKGMEITGHAFRLVGEDKLPQGFEDEFLNAFIHLFESRSVFRSHPEIDTIVDDVMRICEAGPGSALTLMAMVYVISSLIWRGRFRQAMPVFITFFKKSRSDRSPEMMEIRKRILGVAYYVQGKISRAARIFDSISADTDQLPEDSVLLEYYLAVVHCYGLCGRISRSIALLDSIRQHAYARGYHGVEGWALATLGVILIETGRYERAGQVIKELEDISGWERHYLSHMESLWTRVYLEYSRGHHHEMAEYLSRLGTKVQKRFPDFFTPTQAELSIALSHMDPGILENTGLSPFVKMSQKMIKDFSRIPAYRLTARIYQAFYAFVSSGDAEAALSEIKDASDLLEARGYYLVVGKARIIEATILCDQARIDEAVSVLNGYAHIIGEFGEDLFGGYLKDLVSPESPQRLLFDAVIGISQALGTLSDKDALIQKALETIGRICHAEREALFMYEGDKGAKSLVLKASQGITRQYAQSDAFCQMFEWIEETAHMTKGRIWRPSNESRGKFQPRAAICAPLIIRGEVVGVIYMDNRIIQDAFDFADIQLIGALATQVAASVENSRAYKKIDQLNAFLLEKNTYYEGQMQGNAFKDVVISSKAMQRVTRLARKVARADTSVLLTGETGVGKDVVARIIHRFSQRSEEPFICVNCAALPEGLIESELFGHEKGAFTGAGSRRIGRFELADKGTIFLDEIGELPLHLQPKLLNVLQSAVFERIGGTAHIKVDVRIVAATNRDLEAEIHKSRFRADLFYRLNAFPIYIPPLRKRRDDIPDLACHFLSLASKNVGRTFEGITNADMERLQSYSWPGNIRELRHVIERSAILSPDDGFRVTIPSRQAAQTSAASELRSLEEVERDHIIQVLEGCGWKVSGPYGAARILGLKRTTLVSRMKKLGIERPGANNQSSGISQ